MQDSKDLSKLIRVKNMIKPITVYFIDPFSKAKGLEIVFWYKQRSWFVFSVGFKEPFQLYLFKRII